METTAEDYAGALTERLRSGEPGLFFITCPALKRPSGTRCGEHLDAALFAASGRAVCPACGNEIGFDIGRVTVSVS